MKMPEDIWKRITSRKWLREAISGRARNLVNSFHFSPSVIERDVAGEKHLFYLGNVTGKSWYGSQSDFSHEMRFVKEGFVKPGDTVLEVGAHHGAQTILLSRWVGVDGKVVAVEPVAENVRILERNIELNRSANVSVVAKAAGATCDRLPMTQKSNASVRAKGNSTIDVECVTLDKLAGDLGITPTFIKIDVEGYEYKVLEGSRSVLSAFPALFVEVHTLALPRYGNQFEDLWQLIDQTRYDIFIQAEDSEEPVPYARGRTPQGRVHLFFKPRQPRR